MYVPTGHEPKAHKPSPTVLANPLRRAHRGGGLSMEIEGSRGALESETVGRPEE